MAVVENVGANTEVGAISPSPPSSVTSQGSGASSNEDQGENGVHGEIRSHVEGSGGGESFKREIRELNELLTKLNPMAKEFVPPSLTKQGANGGFFTVADSFLGAAEYFPVNEDGGFRRVIRHVSLRAWLFVKLKLVPLRLWSHLFFCEII